MPRSFAAGVLNRLESSSQVLDEVLAVEFAKRREIVGVRRHRAKLLVQEVVRRRATLDQILKVYSSRPPAQMENHVRTVLRMALAEWFFVEPIPGERPGVDADAADGEAGDEAEAGDGQAPDSDNKHTDAAADGAARDVDGDDRDDDGDPEANGHKRRGRWRRRGRRRRDEWIRHADDNSPIARGPIAAAAVNLVGPGRPSRGFVNGVLRAIDRETRYDADATIGPGDFPRNRIPAPFGGVFTFKRTLFADPERKPATWLAQYASLPRWLAERFVHRYGLQTALDVADACNRTSSLSLRVNTLRTTPEKLLAAMAADGIEAVTTDLPEVLRIATPVPLVSTLFFERGEFYLQDFTAARIANVPELTPGMRVLDACAAPGGKITHVYERLEGEGQFTALDASQRRLRLLRENLERLGHEGIEVICADLRKFADDSDAEFDVIFVDAPCTNTGVLARRADARWRVSDEQQKSLITLQLELLQAAARRLAPGGRIVYSTCTLEPEENRGVVVQSGLELHDDALWLPEAGLHDGGYHALLSRKG